MRFHNATKHEQKFTVGKHEYVVPCGYNVDIPDNLAYVVKSRGMALVEGSAKDPEAPVARATEDLPGRAKVLLASPRISREAAEQWKTLYAHASNTERARLLGHLEAVAEGRGAIDVSGRGDEDDEEPQDAPDTSVDAQLDGAAAAVGKGRKKG